MHWDGHGSCCCLRISWELRPWLQVLPRETCGGQRGTLQIHPHRILSTEGAKLWMDQSQHFNLENVITGNTVQEQMGPPHQVSQAGLKYTWAAHVARPLCTSEGWWLHGLEYSGCSKCVLSHCGDCHFLQGLAFALLDTVYHQHSD